MARSDLSGKWPRAWQRRSHAMNATKRWFKPNIIKKWVNLNENNIRLIAKLFFKDVTPSKVEQMVAELDWQKIKLQMTAKEYKLLRTKGAV